LFLASNSNWLGLHRLARGATANSTFGFVSKRWTQVIPSGNPPAPAAAGPTFTIDVVDVGTGLAVLVRGADFTLVYDAGSNDDLARGPGNRMLAYMKDVVPTLTIIDHVILSHPHRDHVELLPDLFAAYQVRQVWVRVVPAACLIPVGIAESVDEFRYNRGVFLRTHVPRSAYPSRHV